MAMHGAVFGRRQQGVRGLFGAVVGVSLFVTGILARAGAAADSETPSLINPPAQPAPSIPSSSLQEQIVALRKEQLELAQRLLAEFPRREGALVLMGNVLQFQARGQEADRFWRQALQINPKRADVYWSLGQRALLAGSYEEAVSHWRKVLEIDPRMPQVSGNLALALMGLGRHQEAVDVLEKGPQAANLSGFDRFVLGQAYLQLGQLGRARDNYEKAIQLQPDYTNAHYGLFTVCTRLGQRDKAREHLAAFQRLKAREMKVLKDRNDVHSDLQEVRGGVAETYVAAHLLYRDPPQPEKAEQLVRRAVAIDPTYAPALRASGDLSQVLGRVAEAEQAYRALIEADPNHADGYRELALLYLRGRVKLPEARQLAEKAVALEPAGRNYFVLSRAYDQNGDPGRALAALQKAVDLEPANSSYRQTYERLRARESQR